LTLLALATVMLSLGETALLVEQGAPVAFWCLGLTGLVYVACGLVAWTRRPGNRTGPILVLAGLSWFMAAAGNLSVPSLAAAGTVFASAPLAFVVWLLHAFPSGQLRTTVSRVTVPAAFVVAVLLQAPQYLFAASGSPQVTLVIADRPALAAQGLAVQAAAGVLVMLATAWVLLQRSRRAPAEQRRVLVLFYAYGILAVLCIPVGANVLSPLLGWSPLTLLIFQLTMLAGLPVALLLAMLQGVFARTGDIEELGAWIADPTTQSSEPLLTALRQTLGDPSVQLQYQSDDGLPGSQRTPEGPAPGEDRASVEVDYQGRTLGMITYDTDLNPDPEPVRAAATIVAIALENQRLSAELRTNQAALQVSRERLVEAGDRERRGIAQNLHDGLQVELVLLALQAQQMAELRDTPEALPEAATQLRVRIDDAAHGLRELVSTVMPAALLERGLLTAAEDLVDRMPLPTTLAVHGTVPTLTPIVGSTAYFVIAEALANAVKHANARRIAVDISRVEQRLIITVTDDGIGGAAPGQGAGLRGLADRVDVLGGCLVVDSPVGGGTRLCADLPCESRP
jgi:signal transduction histidine kinase